MTKPQNDLCTQRRLRSAWASAQSGQSLCCPHEETLGSELPIEHTVKTLIRRDGCPGGSESSLGAHAILLVLSCRGSIMFAGYVSDPLSTLRIPVPLSHQTIDSQLDSSSPPT